MLRAASFLNNSARGSLSRAYGPSTRSFATRGRQYESEPEPESDYDEENNYEENEGSQLPGGLDAFGVYCFNQNAMREYIEDAESVIKAIEDKKAWSPDLIAYFAEGAHRWAAERGCTHITHVFQPLSGVLGEKHDIMFSVDNVNDPQVQTQLKPSQLVSSEPDASSFPNGGLRPTHAARGNCIWDPQSYLTVSKIGSAATLRVPAIFVGWNNHALDHKLPLLRSEEALQTAVLNFFKAVGESGNTRVDSHCGLEQEFFLIEDEYFAGRPDLLACGRTLIGRDASRDQDHSDRYFGWQSIKMQDAIFEMENEFWKLGIPNSTRHREVAPAQYEMAPSFERANQANDNNLIMMQVMREIAKKHELAVLFHEKPFANINGSGKHNNWSFGTNKYRSFFRPENPFFLPFTAAFTRAVHLNGDILRASIATAGNDHRLGGHEAPPGIMSIYVGDEVDEMIQAATAGKSYKARPQELQKFGVTALPEFYKQTSDRNRTSPIAFCGNRFEFRAVGASVNTAWSTTCLNTIIADSINYLTEKYKAAVSKGAADPLGKVTSDLLSKHKDAIFNGNGYSEEWVEEAAKRGLPNSRDTPDALKSLNSEKNQKIFSGLGVLSPVELQCRSDVAYSNFALDVGVEVRTMVELINLHVLPAAYQQFANQEKINIPEIKESAQNLGNLIGSLHREVSQLAKHDEHLDGLSDDVARADYIKSDVRPGMARVRKLADELEGKVASSFWTLPTYHDMLHSGH